jgi:RNA polymerase sigma-70 factor, ECF subfamily
MDRVAALVHGSPTMSARPRPHRLTFVAENAAAQHAGAPAVRSSARDIDWSILMARAQSGDVDAYRRLLGEVVPYLRPLVARWHRDQRDVEDTVQDVLLTLHTIRHTYDPNRPFTPWLAAIANRRIIDRLRRQGRSRRCDAALRAELETFGQPQTNIEETTSREVLRRAVESLPPGQRQAVTLLKLQEMSLKQAAAASGMSIAALKVAMHRAIKNLRKMFGRMGGES